MNNKGSDIIESAKKKSFMISASCMNNIGILAVAVEEVVGMQASINTQSIEIMSANSSLSKSIDEAKGKMHDLGDNVFKVFFESVKANPKNVIQILTKVIVNSKGSIKDVCAPFADVAGNIAGNMPVHMIEILGLAAVSYVGAKVIRSMYSKAGIEIKKEKQEAKKGFGVLSELYKKTDLISGYKKTIEKESVEKPAIRVLSRLR